MKLSGIFGGTFDPVHLGHLRIASDLLDYLSMDEIRFIPCGMPPHRQAAFAPADTRLEMLRAATASQSGFVVDDRELRRPGPSYSIDTLESLCAEMPDRRPGLILGMDAFLGFDTWHRWQDILQLAHLIVVTRPGAAMPDQGAMAELYARRRVDQPAALLSEDAGRVVLCAAAQLEISSSAIRQLVSSGRDPRFLVTGAVRQIISDSGCYRKEKLKKNTSKEVHFSA
jgi:nicotinate-nucleotide adenylyltransferase